MKKTSEFEAPYIGIETIDNTPILYNRRGDYSVIIKCENPIIQYSADMDAYYDFHHLFTNIPVSYTHLDVYKRQPDSRASSY